MSRREELRQRLAASHLYLVTDERLAERDLLDRLAVAIPAGGGVVQFRAPTLKRRELLRRAAEVQRICRELDALFIVNDAADVAALLGADGLHLGQDDLPAAEARRLLGPDPLIGVSVSAVEEARLATADPAVDYLGVGAMFPTGTKPDAEYGGPDLLRAVRAEARLPLVAIGGITAENVGQAWDAGADLVAVVSAVFFAEDSAAAARALLPSD